MGIERRRGARIKASFWIFLEGIDQHPQLRRGNISFSGIFFEANQRIGNEGRILRMQIADFDQQHTVNVMARLVRELKYNDWWRGDALKGIAWEFLFESQQHRKDLEAFVRQVAQRQASKARDLQMHYLFAAQVGNAEHPPKEATVHTLTADGMVMETAWPIQLGEIIQVEVQAPASQKVVKFCGKAVGSNRTARGDGTEQFTINVRFLENEGVHPILNTAPSSTSTAGSNPISVIGHSIVDALDTLLSESTMPPNADEPLAMIPHLTGTLQHIRLSSLLTFLELERRTGVIELKHQARTAWLFMQEGRLLDAEMTQCKLPPLEIVSELLDWNDGDFKIAFQAVDRADRFGIPTNALLLELCLKKDRVQQNSISPNKTSDLKKP